MRRINQNEKEYCAGQNRRAGDGADPDDFAARSLVEVLIFDGGAVFERHQEPSDDTLLARHHTRAMSTHRCRGLVVALVRRGQSTMSARCPVCPKADTGERFMRTRPTPSPSTALRSQR